MLRALCFVCLAAPGAAQEYRGPALHLERVASGVYVTVFANLDDALANGNGTVIVNDSDVVVIDTQDSPGAARLVIAEIRKLTKNPVRYVINTHFHGDHVFGNQAYRAEFPGVEFIGHPNTAVDLETHEVPDLRAWVSTGLPAEIKALEGRLSAIDADSSKGASKAAVARRLAADRWLISQLQQVQPIAPTLRVADSLVLFRGSRHIVVMHPGPANTRGDLIVYLPRERVLVTGDLVVAPEPYATDSFVEPWIAAMQRLRALPADVIVPGHGAMEHDYAYFDLVTDALRAVLTQVRAAVEKNLDLEATRRTIDLSATRRRLAGSDQRIAAMFDGNFATPIVASAWHQLHDRLRSPR